MPCFLVFFCILLVQNAVAHNGTLNVNETVNSTISNVKFIESTAPFAGSIHSDHSHEHHHKHDDHHHSDGHHGRHRLHVVRKHPDKSVVAFLKLAMFRSRNDAAAAARSLLRVYARRCDGRFERMVQMVYEAKLSRARRRVQQFERLGHVLALLREWTKRP